MQTDKFPILMRLMHWLMAVTLLGMIGSGWFMAGLDPEQVSYKYDIYFWHKSFGVVAMALIITRIAIRFSSKVPDLPASLHSHEKRLANTVHFLLYAMMLMVPITGILMSDFGGRPIPFFGLTALPEVLENNKELAGQMHSIHILVPYIFLGLISLHVLGALKHRVLDKPENDVLNKML